MKNKIIFAILIILFGAAFRIFLNEKVGIPNFEAVTSLSLLSGSFLGGFLASIISVSMIFFSDLYFGNASVYLFTWSAFILIAVFGALLKKNRKNGKHYFLKITGMGVLSVLFFYLWTNFGWWLTSRMYPADLKGLMSAYIAGLPFLKNQLLSVLMFTPSFALIFSFVSEKITLLRDGKNHLAAKI